MSQPTSITAKDIADFQTIVTETAKKILNDPRAKLLVDKHGMCSVYLESGIGVQVTISIPKK